MGRLNVELPDDQHQRWKDEADDSPEFSSLSELVRYAVEDFISSDDEAGSVGNSQLDPELVASIRETADLADTIETRTAALENKVVERDELTELVSETVRTAIARSSIPADTTFSSYEDVGDDERFPDSDDDSEPDLGPTTVEMLSDDEEGGEDE